MVLNRMCRLVDRDERASGCSELLPASSPPHRAKRSGRSERGEQRDRQATSTAAHRDVGAPPRAGAVVGHRPPEAETAVGTTGLSTAAKPRHAPDYPRHATTKLLSGGVAPGGDPTRRRRPGARPRPAARPPRRRHGPAATRATSPVGRVRVRRPSSLRSMPAASLTTRSPPRAAVTMMDRRWSGSAVPG